MGVPNGYTSAQVVQAVPTGINSALVLISSTTCVNGAATQINNCFSSTYENYTIKFSSLTGPSSGTSITARLGISGTPDTGTNYQVGSTSWAAAASSIALMNYPNIAGLMCSFTVNIYGPQKSNYTLGTTEYLYYDSSVSLRGFYVNTTTAYTDFILTNTDITGGTIKIYGYTNS